MSSNYIYTTESDAANLQQVVVSTPDNFQGAPHLEEERREGAEERLPLEHLLGEGSSPCIQKQPLNEDGS